MAPVINILKSSGDFEVSVCSTGQHKEMLDPLLEFFEIVHDMDFALMNQANGILDLSSQLIKKFDTYLDEFAPDLVLAQGDTTSVLLTAISSYYKKIPFGHVEAGLRTNNLFSPSYNCR